MKALLLVLPAVADECQKKTEVWQLLPCPTDGEEASEFIESSSSSNMTDDNTTTPQSSSKEDHPHSDGDDDQQIPSSPFVTTSDVLKQLNKHLSNLSSPDDDDDAHMMKPPRFELQKRLPNGSAIPASPEEIAAQDFKTKLEQCAAFVAKLATPSDRQHWAERQRQMGNACFGRGDYKGAMDIYLTCLVVKENNNTPDDFVNDTLLPVLNNLAQCTTQLGMHKKTILFCEMALEEAARAVGQQPPAVGNNETDDSAATTTTKEGGDSDEETTRNCTIDPIALCKIHFKKAKALRLTGDYGVARATLNASLEQLEKKEREFAAAEETSEASQNTLSLEPYQQAIQREYRHLDTAEKEARRNRQRQKRAMQRVLSSTSNSAVKTDSKTASSDTHSSSNTNTPRPLYADLSTNAEPRQYSRLRARKNVGKSAESSPSFTQSRHQSNKHEKKHPSYSQYYWDMVARAARFLLHVLGDEEVENEEEKAFRRRKREHRVSTAKSNHLQQS